MKSLLCGPRVALCISFETFELPKGSVMEITLWPESRVSELRCVSAWVVASRVCGSSELHAMRL